MLKKYYLIPSYVLFLCFGIFSPAYANLTFQLDTLFNVGNDNGNGVFTLSNATNEVIYIQAEVLQIQVENGKIKKIPLTRENFPIWDLAVNPSQIRLLPGEIRDVATRYLCQSNCDRSRDLVYQVRFTPVAAPDQSDEQNVALAFGMAPYYIIPAKESVIDYDWDYDAENQVVKVNNKSNTLLKVEFDNCSSTKDSRNCRALYHVLAGRLLEIELPEGVRGRNVQVSVVNHDQRYEDEFTL
ncbi:hypothetical protein [Vibrio paucivorans]|uniref:Molecular chaperone n=1 Tax=Vibrio paucivorans TaxID=2829489 RepID=A0A9X3HT04_9VIBR|nr:hypothetical protein [Vibrio paucivorans]MCW8335440.1 hypothetical protein [Vibrio paucivorans]